MRPNIAQIEAAIKQLEAEIRQTRRAVGEIYGQPKPFRTQASKRKLH